MSQTNQYVTAIDIGTTKIVALVGKKKSNGRLEVLGVGKAASTGVKRGVVLNIEETANAIQQAVEEAQKKSDIAFTDVYVGIAGQHIKSVKTRGYRHLDSNIDEITQNDVDALVQDMHKIPIQAGEEIIHVIPQNYIVDNESGVKQPIGMSGRRLEANFHIVIGQIASAKNIKKCINRSNLNVIKLILEPLAASEAVLTDDEKEVGVALVDIGGGTTDVAVFYDGIIRHTAVIPFGGNVITQDIKEGCSILQRQAERLKVQYGLALAEIAPEDKAVTIPGIKGRDAKEITFKSLASIIQARMEEIIEAVHYEIENSAFHRKLGAGVVLTGGGSLLQHVTKLFRLQTGLDVRIGLPDCDIVESESSDIQATVLSTGIGLLLKGVEHKKSLEKEIIVEDNKKEEKTIEEPVKDKEKAVEEKKENKKETIFSSLKNTIFEIFEERDTKM